MSKVDIAKHLQNEGEHKLVIHRISARYQTTTILDYKKNPDRPASVTTPQMKKKISNLFERDPSISLAAAARMLKINPKTLSKTKVQKLSIKAYTKKKAPKCVKDQEQRAKPVCHCVYKKIAS